MRIRKMGLVLTCATVLFARMAAAETSAQEYRFDITRQSVASALQEFSKQTGLGVSLSINDSAQSDLFVGPLQGSYTAEAALQELLARSGLGFVRVNESTVAVLSELPQRDRFMRLAARQPVEAPVRQKLAAAPAASAAGTTSSDVDRSKIVEEIIVTAQKRQERLQDVPISITVLGGEELDNSTAQSVGEMLNRVPGMNLDPGGGSGAVGGGVQLASRGVTAPGAFAQGPAPVGYYVDSVPFGLVRSALVPDPNLYDLERVEVLRGPQGTLYGASAQAGVVRVLTKDADLEQFQLKSRALYSHTEYGGNNGGADAAINVPIIDGKLAARAVVSYQDLSGWIDKPTRKDANDTTQKNARLKLNAQPTPEFSIGLSGWMSRSEAGGWPYASDGRGRANAVADVESLKTDFDVAGLKMNYDFPVFSLTSATSYIDYRTDSNFSQRPANAVRDGSYARTALKAYTFAQEFNLTSNQEGPWRWTAGAMYRKGLDLQFQDISLYFSPLMVRYTSESWAAFGELTRRFFDGQLELTAGLRYFEDKVGQVHRSDAGPLPAPGRLAPPVEDKFDKTTPRVILNWHPSAQTTVYASYAEGFRSGLPQNPIVRRDVPSIPPTEPDLLKNYEIGAKGSLFDGRLSYDTSAYYMNWEDVQIPLLLVLGNIGRNVLINGTSASGPGVDFAVTARPYQGIEVGLNASWNDLRINDQVFSNNILLFRKGDRLNSSVETTVGAFASYNFPLGGGGLEGTFSASANRRTRMTERSLAGSAAVVRTGDPILIARTSFAVNSRAGWGATLFVDNLTNEQGVMLRTASLVPGLASAFYPRPRTVGLQLDYKFE